MQKEIIELIEKSTETALESARKIGELSGRTLAEEMQRRGWAAADTAACIVTFEELDTARERTEGIIAALQAAGFPADRIYKTPQKTTDIPGSFDAANALLAQKTGVKNWLVAGMNDSATLGAVRATEGNGFAAAKVHGCCSSDERVRTLDKERHRDQNTRRTPGIVNGATQRQHAGGHAEEREEYHRRAP